MIFYGGISINTIGYASFSKWCWLVALGLSSSHGSVTYIFIEAFYTRNSVTTTKTLLMDMYPMIIYGGISIYTIG
jgi:hypothetical protein